MDAGTWTLKCQHCGETFDLELTEGQRVVEFARDKACPGCKISPLSATGNTALANWHHVIGFHASPKRLL